MLGGIRATTRLRSSIPQVVRTLPQRQFSKASKARKACPIACLRQWFKEYVVSWKLCPFAAKGLTKSKFIECPANGNWVEVLDFVEKEAQELKSAERRFPDGKDCIGTFIVLPKMEDEEAELLYRFIYNRFHEQEIRGNPIPPDVDIFLFMRSMFLGFSAPVTAYHLVSKEALDWASEVYREKHGLSPSESVADHMNMQNSRTYDEMYRTRAMHKMAKRCSELADRCLRSYPAVDVDKSYAGHCELRRQLPWYKG